MAKGRRILVICPEWDKPAGGVRKLYRHVDVLSSHGYPAYISHHQQGFRCTWFENNTPVLYPPDCYPRGGDILVVPELYAWDLCRQTPGVPKVIYNQNAYQTFAGIVLADPNDPAPYARPDVLGTIVVSEDSRRYLSYAFPGHRIYRIRHSVDPAKFFVGGQKRKRIAYMPRKLPEEAGQVLGILKARGALAGVELVKIEDMDESQTAAVLRESLIFLSFAAQEGWALPPMEAMACRCIVIGYHGRGGSEYFTREYGFPIEAGDVVTFAATVEAVLKQFATDPTPLREMALRASQYVPNAFSQANEVGDILGVWDQVLQLPELPV